MAKPKADLLIVDDEESIREVLARRLKDEGYACWTASDGAEALATASKHDFDLVLTDIKMPGLSGMDVLTQLAAISPDTGVVMVSAMADAQTAIEAMKLGAYDYVTKPFDLDALRIRIDNALEKRRLILENREYRLREAQQALETQEKYFKSLIENSQDAIVVLNSDGSVRYESPYVGRVLGRKTSERAGESGFKYIHPDDSPGVAAAFERILKNPNETARLEFRLQDSSGSWHHFEAIGRNLLEDPAVRGVVANLRDTTERKLMETALRESQQEYEVLLSNIPDAVFRYMDGRMTWTNEMIEQILGYTPDELSSTGVGFFLPEDVDLRGIETNVNKIIKKEGHFHGEIRAKRKDGSVADIEYSASHIPGKTPIEIVGVARDITEQKKARQALLESERRLQTILDSVHSGVVLIDAETHVVVDANPTALELFEASRDEIVGQRCYESICPAQEGKCPITDLGETIRDSEQVLARRDGTTLQILRTVTTIDLSGRQYLIHTFVDISERKEAEKSLNRQERYFRALTENSSDVITVINADGTVRYESPSYQRVFGVKPEERVNEGLLERIHPDDMDAMTKAFARFIRGRKKTLRVETRARHADGSWRWIEAVGTNLLKDPAVEGIVVNMRDITERKEAEEALRQSEEKLRLMFEAVADGIAVVDLNGVITDCNTRTVELHGYGSKNDLIGKSAFDLIISPEQLEAMRDMDRLLNRGVIDRLEHTYTRVDGTQFEAESSASVMRDANGNPTGFIGVTRDISERKRTELDKERLNRELTEKNAELEQIVYVTSHDLRSPLVNIQGFSKELGFLFGELASVLEDTGMDREDRDDALANLNRETSDALHFIETSTSKMDTLLSGLLRLSRLGRAALNFETLDMNAMLSDVEKSLQYRINEAQAQVEIDSLPPCTGDAVQVNQVFSNLLDNALKYLDPARKGVIKVTGWTEGEQSVYAVEDNGVGIAEEHQTKVFEVFQRINPDMSEGEGLGLAVVKKILGRHGGSIRVESKPSIGSKFFVSLPASPSDTTAKERG